MYAAALTATDGEPGLVARWVRREALAGHSDMAGRLLDSALVHRPGHADLLQVQPNLSTQCLTPTCLSADEQVIWQLERWRGHKHLLASCSVQALPVSTGGATAAAGAETAACGPVLTIDAACS